MVEGGGFEPPKASPTDLQSVPFGHSGTPPNLYHVLRFGRSRQSAGERNRTPDRLITNQLLYHLSYAGYSKNASYNSQSRRSVKSFYCLAKEQNGNRSMISAQRPLRQDKVFATTAGTSYTTPPPAHSRFRLPEAYSAPRWPQRRFLPEDSQREPCRERPWCRNS